MHEKNIALLCDEADRLLQLNINLLRQMVDEPDVLSDSKNENGLLFDKQKALKRIEELEGEQIKTARREMVLAVVGTMKAGKSTTINAIVGQEILPNRNRPMTSVPTLIRHVPGKTEPVLHLEHTQPVRNLLITLQEKLATPAGQQVAQTLQQTGDTRELLDILTDDGWLKNEYHGEEEIFTGLASLNDLVRLAAAMGSDFPFDEYAEVQKLPVIDVEFSHLVGMDACQGTLTLLDTPGPNEAGQPQMEVMMRDQLQKASAVLAVMDYTQMNSKADEDVRKELNAIADVSAGRLFVLVNKFDEKDRNGDGADAVRQKVPAMLNSDVLPASRVYPGSSRQAYLANRALHELRKNGTLPVDEAWVDDFVREAFGRMKKDYVCKDSELATEGATDLWEGSLIDQLITEVIQSSHSRAAALAVDSAAAKLMQNAENVSEYLSLRHQGLQQSIQSLQAHITSLLADIQEIEECQNQVTGDVRMAMEDINTKTGELLTKVCASLEEELNDYFRSGKRKEQQMLEEENSAQPRERNAFAFFHDIFGTGNQHDRMRDFDPDSPEIKFSDRRAALELMTQIESTVTSLHREAEAQFRPELEKIVRGIETGFRGTALYATEKIAGRINARLEDEGFTVKISFPAVSQLQTRLAVQTNLSALMEERTETVTRRRRQDGVWGTLCRWANTSDWGWKEYSVDVSRSVINMNKVRKEVMSLTRAYFGELQASIEQNINQPVRQEIDDFFCTFREKVEQLRNTLIQSSEDHKRDQQAQEHLTERLQALNERVPELITDSKALREELETML
ncbi:dynamin family protein [Escherichia coli]|uniref:Dynamin family protein n=33 Tax=Escherichia coli TaxID=562 RepID=A0A2A2C8L8_ECOLX|nr:dynamin family protein [Escherichia coli]EER0917381.1 dGTPase [Escherichia coli O168:H8]EES8554872.1 dGTPase [Escherichia coli O168]EEZ8572827.1 dGTPase [Escherichia coli O113]EFA4148082.1 dGTPase [Escherichia coli O99:H27]EHY1580209.1 dynamin family protein [Escherichia coli O8]EHY2166507.1 dynamin family protein [Escherichia coli O157]EKE4542719.1 dynamin family protein [Escherichia coli O103]ELP2962333.1 dynamin family protein [Escherichia coli O83]HBP1718055.1 dynamin family protein